MKKVIIVVGVLLFGAMAGWHNGVNRLVWGLPIVKDITDPVPSNVDIQWPARLQRASGRAAAEYHFDPGG